jgi:hypothetical protein
LGNRIRMNQTVFYCTERPYTHGHTRGRLICCFNGCSPLRFDDNRLNFMKLRSNLASIM